MPVFNGDTFGGDAGGSDNGKDHLWRYYEPTEQGTEKKIKERLEYWEEIRKQARERGKR